MKKSAMVVLFMMLLLTSCVVVTGSNQSKAKIANQAPIEAYAFDLSDVRLLDGPFKAAMERDAAYLLLLEPDRLLSWFRKEAGLAPKGEVYGGWENQTIAGHSLGHYLSACAMMYTATGDKRFKERTDYIVDELALCQDKNGNGYLAAFPGGKRCFEEVARGEIRSKGFDLNGIWVPWYTLHKEMAGLRDTYLYCDNDKALKVWVKLTDWAYNVTDKLTEAQWQKMLDCEQGGMKEVCADLYSITGDKKYLTLAQRFTHKKIMDPLSQRKDILPGVHGNTQIPKMIGAARQYELTGDEYYKTIAEFSWDTIVHHHTYVNGGHGAGEYFGPEDKLNDRLNDTTETCNTYNMLKLTEHLFTWKPSSQLGDYYERAVLNHILAHQHPVTGMLKYKGFLDMPAHKNFCTPFGDFWCCTGTGMENHAKYGDGIYYHKDNALYVNLFIASQLDWKQKGLTVRQETKWPHKDTVRLTFSGKTADATVFIRKPFWTNAMTISINGKPVAAKTNDAGFIVVERKYKDGDIIELKMPMNLRTESMPDNPGRVAFFYGPILLCADLDGGQDVPALVGRTDALLNAFSPILDKPLELKAKGIGRILTPDGWKEADIHLVPHFEVADQWYTVYMDVFNPSQWEQKQKEYQNELRIRKETEARTVDSLGVGQMQPERDHNLDSEKSNVGEFSGHKWRDARDGGWFAFDMKVLPDTPMELICTYWGSDGDGREFDILVNDIKIATQKLNNDKPGKLWDKSYAIPEELTKGKEKVRVKFAAHPGRMAGGLYGCRVLKKQ
jgi:DUF1680 family protein